ncbi:MAG TPA: hypothetical protein PK280_03450 [Planctomycetota bacterium]|nr:hypothetical protein [Planctomycetota bacterium]
MWRKTALITVCLALPAAAMAHLCNDVFVQAKDNLAVKVDVRDGQLRIGQEASFRVYLLNTMDRDIAAISLSVTSPQFTAEVKPDNMVLRTAKKGGTKGSFEVTLKRNPGVPDGKYKIDLCLFNPKNKAQVFKTLDLDSAAGVVELPKGAAVKVDGAADAAEWDKTPVCTDFYTYGKKSQYQENLPCQDQARCRLAADADNLYCLLQFGGGAGASGDQATIYVSPNTETKPVAVTIDRLTAKATCDKGTDGIEVKPSADKSTVECKIPLALLGIKGSKSFHANFTRTLAAADGKKTESYWRGNSASLQEPIVYGQFKLAE